VTLDDGDLVAALGEPSRGNRAARAGADHDDVEGAFHGVGAS
jgi:hypothetical protein